MRRRETKIGRVLRIANPPQVMLVGRYKAAEWIPSFRVTLRIVRKSKYNRDGSERK